MSQQVKLVRGMHDILPEEVSLWHFVEDQWRELVASYGYQQIRTPVLEKTALFHRSIGEVTDIVEKEMYSFEDRGGEHLSLRPEGTAGVVRSGIEHGLLYNQQQRLWYNASMFRRERPQKGRYRQFHQFGAETFGMPGADIEAELIFLVARFWKKLGLTDIRLEINSLGTSETRERYRNLLVEFFQDHHDQLDEDSQRRLRSNPLRILDSKNPAMKTLVEQAPSLLEHLDEATASHFEELQSILQNNGQEFTVNPRLVRGLDYYSHTVFEWMTDTLGAQGTVCAGGRYDGLVEQLGGKPTTAAGFGMGIERLILMVREQQVAVPGQQMDIFFIVLGEKARLAGQKLAETLRSEIQSLKMLFHCGEASMKSQMKKADKSQAAIALILGEQEVADQTISIKFLRSEQEQLTVNWQQLVPQLKQLLD